MAGWSRRGWRALFAVGTRRLRDLLGGRLLAIRRSAGPVPLLALSAGNNVVFWLLAASLFDDGFRLRWWHGALWLLLVDRRPRPMLPVGAGRSASPSR